MEFNLVEMWLRFDKTRWIAGFFASIVATALAIGLAMVLSQMGGLECWFPVKLMATTLLGASATEIGPHMSPILVGTGVIFAICLFWGLLFAHFTGTNSLKALLPLGAVWGLFAWIFLWNLFIQSFRPIFAARIPSGPVFPICMAYGLGLASVALFDRAFRRR